MSELYAFYNKRSKKNDFQNSSFENNIDNKIKINNQNNYKNSNKNESELKFQNNSNSLRCLIKKFYYNKLFTK